MIRKWDVALIIFVSNLVRNLSPPLDSIPLRNRGPLGAVGDDHAAPAPTLPQPSAKRGRRKKPSAMRTARPVTARLTRGDYAQLAAHLAETGERLSTFLRRAILKELSATPGRHMTAEHA